MPWFSLGADPVGLCLCWVLGGGGWVGPPGEVVGTGPQSLCEEHHLEQLPCALPFAAAFPQECDTKLLRHLERFCLTDLDTLGTLSHRCVAA